MKLNAELWPAANNFPSIHSLTTFLVDLVAEHHPGLQAAMITLQSVNRCLAQEMYAGTAAQHPHVAHNDTFAIRVMRGALETAETTPELNPPEVFIPAAVEWILILGSEMYSWAKRSSYRGQFGNEGTGGPLWYGKHGYCIERWKFWKHRFNDLSSSSELVSQELRELAKNGAAKMSEVETQHLDNQMQDAPPIVTEQTHAGLLKYYKLAMEKEQRRKVEEEKLQYVAETQMSNKGKQDESWTVTQQTHGELPPVSSAANQAETSLIETRPAGTKTTEKKPAETKQAKTYADCLKDNQKTNHKRVRQ